MESIVTARDLAGLPTGDPRSPHYPKSTRGVRKFLHRAGFHFDTTLTNGGHAIAIPIDLLSQETRLALLKRRAGTAATEGPSAEAWSAFGLAPSSIQAEAARQLDLIFAIEAECPAGLSEYAAVNAVADLTGESRSTLQRLMKKIRGVSWHDWLPTIAKRYKGRAPDADLSPDAWAFFLRFLSESAARMPLKSAWKETWSVAKNEGWSWPSYATVRRRYLSELTPAQRALVRSGPKAMDATFPPQRRTVAHMTAMEMVTLDGRMLDLFACWEDGTISRPVILAIEDVFSRRPLAWRIVKSENADDTKRLLLDVFDRFGMFDALYTDNSRAFTSNRIAGGQPHRFRRTPKDGEPDGLLKMLSIDVRFAKPANGRAKPVERFFLDVASSIDTRPEFKGAYCGHKPEAKPEDFAGRAVDIATVRATYDREISRAIAEPGRRTEMAAGKLSVDQVFRASFEQRPLRPLTAAQRRWFMLDQAYLKPDRQTGELRANGFSYWSAQHQPTLANYAGQKLRVLFDQNDRSKPVVVETLDGRMLIEALPCLERGRFDSADDARDYERAKAGRKKAERVALQKSATMSAKLMDNLRKRRDEAEAPPAPPPVPAVNVMQPVFGQLGMKARPVAATRADDDGTTEVDRKLAGKSVDDIRQRMERMGMRKWG